jgi:hypothetical protein
LSLVEKLKLIGSVPLNLLFILLEEDFSERVERGKRREEGGRREGRGERGEGRRGRVERSKKKGNFFRIHNCGAL